MIDLIVEDYLIDVMLGFHQSDQTFPKFEGAEEVTRRRIAAMHGLWGGRKDFIGADDLSWLNIASMRCQPRERNM